VSQRSHKVGVVASNKMQKTVVVIVERYVRHARLKRYVTVRKRYPAHDGGSICKVGDVVEVVGTRPLSRTKRWAVTRVIRKAK